MKNEYKVEGDMLTLLAPYNVTSGDGFLVGMIFAVAAYTALSGAAVEGKINGAFTLAKTTAQAWTVGQSLYWDNAGKKVTSTNTGNKFIGYCIVAAAAADTTGVVLLSLSKDVLA